MAAPYAEVIGDPITHSLSPTIHRHWLRQLGLPGDYRTTRVTPDELTAYLNARAADASWRGCNLTMPLKEAAWRLGAQDAALLSLDDDARAARAVNCIARASGGLVARNTDIQGVHAALDTHPVGTGTAIVLGAGGAARAAVIALARRGMRIIVLARSPERAAPLRQLAPELALKDFADAPAEFAAAGVIINATPLGMDGGPPMPKAILGALSKAPTALAIDMVYRPLRTSFLAAAEAANLATADGLNMLIGQAHPAFAAFFDREAPQNDAALRAELIAQSPGD